MAETTRDRLLEAIQALSFARTLEEVPIVTRTRARALTGADGVTFVLRDDEQCFYADEDAIAPLWKGRRFPMDTCISGWVMRHRERAVIPDIYADPRIPHDAYRPTFVKSLAMVPVRTEAPVAAIGAYWADQHTATADELSILETLANATALALANVELYGHLQDALGAEQRARLDAEEANRLKDEFLATLSHELRTPLAVVQGWLWQLRQRTAAPHDVHRGLEVIERNVRHQARLVEDLLDASRAIGGKLKIEPGLVDLSRVCRDVEEVARPAAAAKGVSLDVAPDVRRPLMVWGDADRLQQILWNLVANAIKFTPAGGAVSVAGRRAGNRAELLVRDTGVGIAPELLPYVFDRFRQGDSGSTRRFGGLGLGLAIVKELVELHGGQVAAESAGLNAGTTVKVSLPVAAVLEEAGSDLLRRVEPAGSESRLDGVSVLVVDDEPDACEAVRHILEHHGATVWTVNSADAALTVLRERRPTVLLADLAMPGTDGYALIRAVRSLEGGTSHIPAAAFSAFLADEQLARARAAGFELYLEKPVSAGTLAQQVARLVRDRAH